MRKDLYRHLKAQVRQRLGPEPMELKAFKKHYDKEFHRPWRASSLQTMVYELLGARLLLMGDFHTLRQSQKAQLKILKTIHRYQKKIVLCLECVDHEDQSHVDDFLAGKLSSTEFIKKVHWIEKWGFPFKNYKIFFKWARKNKIPVFALNDSKISSLRKRDQKVAQHIQQILEKYPQELVAVSIGDLHLAKGHLLREVLKLNESDFIKKTFRIFQNSEKLYFQFYKKNSLEKNLELVSSGKRDFCLLHVPPWVKWQNYLMFLEETYDQNLEEDSLDFTDCVEKYVQILSYELGVQFSKGGISVYSQDDEFFWMRLEDYFPSRELLHFKRLMEEGESFYIPELHCGYLGRVSVNHASSLAMQYIHAQLSERSKSIFVSKNNLLQLIWIEAFSYLGSKWINPQRKTETLEDLKVHWIYRKKTGNSLKEPLQIALIQKMNDLHLLSGDGKKNYSLKVRKKWSYWRASHYLGGLLGEKIHQGLQSGILNMESIHFFMRARFSGSDKAEEKNIGKKTLRKKSLKTKAQGEDIYIELLRLVEHLPLDFKRKREKF